MMVMEDLCSKFAFGDAHVTLVIEKGSIFVKVVVFQEQCWNWLLDQKTLEDVNDIFEFRVPFDGALNLGLEFVTCSDHEHRVQL